MYFDAIERPRLTPVRIDVPRSGDFPLPDFRQYDTARFEADMGRFKTERADPRSSTGFQNLLNLAGSRAAHASEEAVRRGQEIAARRGFVGGYSGEGERTAREMQRATATAGFEAAADIRKEAGARYDTAAGAYANLRRAAADAINERNARYFEALTRGRLAQAEADTAYGAARTGLYDADVRRAAGQTSLYEADIRRASERGHLTLAEQQAAEAQRQAAIDAIERQREFEREDAERQRQYNLEYDLRRQQAGLPPPTESVFTDPYPGGTGGIRTRQVGTIGRPPPRFPGTIGRPPPRFPGIIGRR